MLTVNEGTENLSIPSRGISGSVLKVIAIVAMAVDHVGAALIENGILCTYDLERFRSIYQTEAGQFWYQADWICRAVGRISFPIFCFLLVEGFVHTRNLKRYAAQMFLFALVSEIPFDLAFKRQMFDWGAQNVFFTLGIGLLVLAGFCRYQFHGSGQLAVAAAGCGAAYILKTDYDVFGILLILILYMLRDRKLLQTFGGVLMGISESATFYGSAAFAYIPIWFYNGARGKLKLKYFFYWFYPVHLIFLFLVRTFVMKM